MTQPVKVKATIMYPYLTKVNDRFNADNPKYEVSLTQLSEPAAEALTSKLGLKIYKKEDQGNKITCKSLNSIRAYDTEGNEIDGDIVGNGSECIAVIDSYSNKYGSFPQLSKLVITKLVEYSPNLVGAGVDDDLDVL